MLTFDGEHLLLGHRPTGVLAPGRVAMFGATALALKDAFLVDLGWGWRLVEGIRTGGAMQPGRISLDDQLPGSADRAGAIARVAGVSVLTVEQSLENLERNRIGLYPWR